MNQEQGRSKPEMTILYSYVCRKLATEGISSGELSAIKHYPIGHTSVAGFVELNLMAGNFVWRNNRLLNADRKLGIKLTPSEELDLRDKAKELNLTPIELATKVILEAIKS